MDTMLKNNVEALTMNNSIIVTGAAGFTVYSVTRELSLRGYKVYAVTRPGSYHNMRLDGMTNVKLIQLDASEIKNLFRYIEDEPIAMIHLIRNGNRYDSCAQNINIDYAINALNVAHELGCRRFLCTGSQAEYGATQEIQSEDIMPRPRCGKGYYSSCGKRKSRKNI